MVAWKNVGWIAIVVGLVACHEAAAREPIGRPAEVLAMVSLGPDHTLASLRDLADAIKPGLSAELTEPKLRAVMAKSIGAPSLDGLDPTAPTYIVVFDNGSDLRGAALVAKVGDASAVGKLAVHSVVRNGWAVLGAEPIVTTVAPYALASLPALAVPSTPTVTIYMPQLLRRYHTELEAARAQVGQASANTGQMKAMMQSMVDGTFAMFAEIDQVVVTVEVTQNGVSIASPASAVNAATPNADAVSIDLAMVPAAGSRLAKFVAAQKPSDFGLLAKLPAMTATGVIAGHLEAGPYHRAMLDGLAALYGQGGNQDLAEAIGAVMKSSTGEVAFAMEMGIGRPMAMSQLFALADDKAASRAIDHVLQLFATGRVVDMMSVSMLMKSSPASDHGGISVRGYDVSYDYTAAPAATRAAMEKVAPSGVAIPARVATFDHVAVLTMGKSDPNVAIDAVRGTANRFAPSAFTTDFLTTARARKDSLMMSFDVGAITGKPAGGEMIISAGFAGKTAHCRLTMPVVMLRTLATKP